MPGSGQKAQVIKLVDSNALISPLQVDCHTVKVLNSSPVYHPCEIIYQKDTEITRILEEKRKIFQSILQAISSQSEPSDDQGEQDNTLENIFIKILNQIQTLTETIASSLEFNQEAPIQLTKDAESAAVKSTKLISILESLSYHLCSLIQGLQDSERARKSILERLLKHQQIICNLMVSGGLQSSEAVEKKCLKSSSSLPSLSHLPSQL